MVDDTNAESIVPLPTIVEDHDHKSLSQNGRSHHTEDFKSNGRSILSHVQSPKKGAEEDDKSESSINSVIVFGIFMLSVVGLMGLYASFPEVEESEKPYLTLPTNIEDAKVLGEILSRYKDKYYFSVLAGMFGFYIFLQTFAIPGSIFLSILSGFLFPFFVALGLVCFCSATGATLCYIISHLVGRKLVSHYFPERVKQWADTVKNHREHITNYIIFLRITPFLPNWFINIAAPIIDVPILPFWFGTFIGVAPPSFLAIQAGTTLQQLSSSNTVVSWTSIVIMIAVGMVSLLPIVFKRMLKSKFD